MGRVVDVKTIFIGIEVNLVLPVLDGVDVILDIVKAVLEEGADEAGLFVLWHSRVILS